MTVRVEEIEDKLVEKNQHKTINSETTNAKKLPGEAIHVTKTPGY